MGIEPCVCGRDFRSVMEAGGGIFPLCSSYLSDLFFLSAGGSEWYPKRKHGGFSLSSAL